MDAQSGLHLYFSHTAKQIFFTIWPILILLKNDNLFFQIRLKSSNIKFMELKPSDRGNYTCVASNNAGTLEYTFILNVIGM